jgi:putative methionine-R-sulfoxide reductase with GAF domain
MNPSRYRAILQISSAVVFLMSIAALMLSASNIALNPSLYLGIVHLAAGAFNIAILLSWLTLGAVGGIAFIVLASLVVLLASRYIGYPLAAFVWTFPFTGIIGHLWLKIFSAGVRSKGLEAEKIEEEINLAADGIKKRKAEIDSLKKKIERYARLKEVAETLSTTLSLDEIEALVIDSATRIVGRADRAGFFLVDSGRQELALGASRVKSGIGKIKSKKGDIFDNWVLKQRKTLMIEDAAADFRFSEESPGVTKGEFRSLISAPLVTEGKIMGVLRLDCMKELAYGQEDLRLLDIIADLAAVAVENNRLYTRTEELAVKDGLTDLVVSRYFRERLAEETTRAARTNSRFSLLMLDIDHF